MSFFPQYYAIQATSKTSGTVVPVLNVAVTVPSALQVKSTVPAPPSTCRGSVTVWPVDWVKAIDEYVKGPSQNSSSTLVAEEVTTGKTRHTPS